MNYAMRRVERGTLWVPLPGLVFNPHELPVGEYLLYGATGALKEEEHGGAVITEAKKPPRTFKFEKRIEVYEEAGKIKYRTL